MELMLSLAVIAVILVTATRYYNLVQMQEQVNDAFNKIQSIRSAAARWSVSHNDYSLMTMETLIDRNLVPKSTATSAWGDPTVKGDAATNQYTITIPNINHIPCLNLKNRFNPAEDSTITYVECESSPNKEVFVITFK